jgi:thioredoxin 1
MKLLKKKTILAGMIGVLLLFSACGEKAHEFKADNNKENIKVTFLELGSVGCVPCKMMVPVMEAIEEEYGDQVDIIFYDVRTEEDKVFAEEYQIRMIPTQVFLDSNGKEYFRHEGFFPKEEIVNIVKKKGVK